MQRKEAGLMRLLCGIIFSTMLIGCADTHEFLRGNGGGQVVLERNASAYIAVPRDGVYGGTVYHGSGQNTAQIILAAFPKHLLQVVTAPAYEDYKKSLELVKKEGYNYLIYPVILEWEDRATEWSGIPDRVSVKITVVDANTGRVADSAIVKGRSGWATFGGDHPQDLLPKPTGEYASSLFR